jgi:hypothetical protein
VTVTVPVPVLQVVVTTPLRRAAMPRRLSRAAVTVARVSVPFR